MTDSVPGCLLIRADASSQIGSGHVMRCLALGQAWRAEGRRVQFLTHCETESLGHRLVSYGFEVIPVDRQHPDPADLDLTLSHLQQLTDREAERPWLILDGYHFDSAYQQAVRLASYRLLVIDDTAHLPEYHADVLLNQNIHAPGLAYRSGPDTRLLLGTRYVLLRQEFLRWSGFRRETPEVAHKILVTLGGGDQKNIALRVIQALQRLETDGLEAVIVIGGSNVHADNLQETIYRSPGKLRFRLVQDAANMPELMAWADVAISAGGSTCWELAFMGVPSVVIVLSDNQLGVAQGLEWAGIAVNLGWFSDVGERQILTALTGLLGESERRRRVSAAGRMLVDGAGASRVIHELSRSEGGPDDSNSVRLRPAGMEDVVSLWELANDPGVRGNAFKADPIAFDRHVEWLRQKVFSNGTCLWILEVDGKLAAQVRYDRVDPETAEIDFSVVPTQRGKGLGTRVLALTWRSSGEALRVKRVRGIVIKSNLSSARAFLKAGFKEVAKGEVMHGRPCSIFERIIEHAP